MLEPHTVVGTVTASLSCTHHHADSCTRTGRLYPDSVSSSFFFCIKIIVPLACQKESTVSSGISDRSSTQQPVSAVTLFAAGDCESASDYSLSEQHPVSAETCPMSLIRLPIVALLLNLVVVRRRTPLIVLLFQWVRDRNTMRSIADALTLPININKIIP